MATLAAYRSWAWPYSYEEDTPRHVRYSRISSLLKWHEAALGRPTLLIARDLERTQWRSSEELATLQTVKLQRLLDHAYGNCPYYRKRWQEKGSVPPNVTDWQQIPFLTRAELRQHAWPMCWHNMPVRRLRDHTRGTSDDPLIYYWNRHRQAWDKANRLRGHAWHNMSACDRELHLWPVDPPRSRSAKLKSWLRSQRDYLLGELQIDSLFALGEHLAQTWQNWRRFNPVRITAFPSVLTRLIQVGRQVGCRMGNGDLRRFFLTGEVTFPWQRQLIEQELGVPVAENYGVQEVGALAYECDYGSWHTCAESVLVEFMRQGRPARPGELAEVVATGLESLAMPMIRYCTGDIVRVPAGGAWSAQCRCGRGLPIMPPVLGRAADFLEASNGCWVEPATVVESLGSALDNGTYQVSQAADGAVSVNVSSASSRRSGWRLNVMRRMRDLLGSSVRCEIHEVSQIARSAFGKCRYVNSHRTRQGLAVLNPMAE